MALLYLAKFSSKINMICSCLNSNKKIQNAVSQIMKVIKEILDQEIKIDTNSIQTEIAKEIPELGDWLNDEKINEDIQLQIKKSHWSIKEHIKKCLVNL
jgi:uncharacterized membrane-anchored protein YjiN (DUF445 family)